MWRKSLFNVDNTEVDDLSEEEMQCKVKEANEMGHTVTSEGVGAGEAKVKAITDYYIILAWALKEIENIFYINWEGTVGYSHSQNLPSLSIRVEV